MEQKNMLILYTVSCLYNVFNTSTQLVLGFAGTPEILESRLRLKMSQPGWIDYSRVYVANCEQTA